MRLSTALLLALAAALSGGCKNHSDVADGGAVAMSDALARDQAVRVLANVGDRTITLGDSDTGPPIGARRCWKK
jgi:hypothetical protein